MLGYALLTALKLEHGFRTFMEARHLENLSFYFKNIDQVESLDVLCDEENSYPWFNFSLGVPAFTDGKHEDLKLGKTIDYLNDVRYFQTRRTESFS